MSTDRVALFWQSYHANQNTLPWTARVVNALIGAGSSRPSVKAEPPDHQPWCVLLDDECDCYWV